MERLFAPGCGLKLYKGITTITLWEVLAQRDDFPFPNYKGMEMTIHDACPTRKKPQVHEAIRALLIKMNINVIEPKQTGIHAVCCGAKKPRYLIDLLLGEKTIPGDTNPDHWHEKLDAYIEQH